MRVYVLSKTAYMAEKSDYGPGWKKAWTDPDGNRLLPFREAPQGAKTLTAEEARAFQAQFAPELEASIEPPPEEDPHAQ